MYIGGIMGVCATASGHGLSDCVVAGSTLRYALNDAPDGFGEDTIPGNTMMYGIGGLIGNVIQSGETTLAEGCSVHCIIESSHPRDLGLVCGRLYNNSEGVNTQLGSSAKPITLKGGSRISYSYRTAAGDPFTTNTDAVSSSNYTKLYSATNVRSWSYAWTPETSTSTYNYNASYKMGFLIGSLYTRVSNAYTQYADGDEISAATEGLTSGGSLF